MHTNNQQPLNHEICFIFQVVNIKHSYILPWCACTCVCT